MWQLRKVRVGVIPRPVTEANDMIITLKLMEYWASGTVVVAAPLKAIRQVATKGENVIFFEPGNPDSLAAAVARLLDDPKLCGRIAGGGYERSRDFSWDTLVPQIIDSFGVSRQDID
jgi:glycosyltransferase involved in cell wall biosynthesis